MHQQRLFDLNEIICDLKQEVHSKKLFSIFTYNINSGSILMLIVAGQIEILILIYDFLNFFSSCSLDIQKEN